MLVGRLGVDRQALVEVISGRSGGDALAIVAIGSLRLQTGAVIAAF